MQINLSQVNLEDLTSLHDFQNKLSELGHFYTRYNSIEDLKYKFSEQLIKLIPQLTNQALDVKERVDSTQLRESVFPINLGTEDTPNKVEELSLAQRLKKESLEARLVQYEKDYQALERDYQEAGDSDEKDRLQRKLNRKIEEIENTQKELEQIKKSEQTEKKQKLIYILNYYFNQQLNYLQKAYEISLPERFIDRKLPENSEVLLRNFQLTNQQETEYSYLEKFIGHLCLLSKNMCEPIQDDLTKWIKENIKNYQDLIIQLEQENKERKEKWNPALLVGISHSGNKYVVEGWLIKDLENYNREFYLDCQSLKFNNQVHIPTNAELTNLPKIIKDFIKQSLEESHKYLKQIHIFLPFTLMNYDVDCWQNWLEEQEEKDDEEKEDDNDDCYYATSIGEDYEVIIRCSDRIRGKSPPVYKWYKKADIFQSSLEETASDFFCNGDKDNPKDLFKQVKTDDVIAVKIMKVFQKKEPGQLLWQAGIPLALWIRQQIPNIQQELDALLQNNNQNISLKQLPEQVKIKRGEDTDIGKHLCLLWDDPNLLPPTQLLTDNPLA